MNRRQFAQSAAGLGLAGSLALPVGIMSQAHADAHDLGFNLTQGSRTLKLYRPETGQGIHIEYLKDGVWQGNAYDQLCWLLRDIHVGESVKMDTRLIAILDWTQRYLAKYGYTDALHILSAYRSMRTNGKTEGAAKNSQHLLGKALDIRIPGLSADYLGRLFTWLSQGGVGIYSDQSFIHLDTGRLRAWRG